MAKDKIDQLTEIVKAGFASLETRMEKGFGAVAEDVEELRTELKGDIANLERAAHEHGSGDQADNPGPLA